MNNLYNTIKKHYKNKVIRLQVSWCFITTKVGVNKIMFYANFNCFTL